MNSPVRSYRLAKILLISQLRSSRSEAGKSRIWDRPAFILLVNALGISLAWLVTFEVLSVMPADLDSTVRTVSVQVLAFIPMFLLAMVLLAGIIFELNTSSRFASSDLVNWLPISKSEYVAASASSIAYIYSPYLFVAVGVTLALAIQTQHFLAWTVSFGLSAVALLTGGFLVEILRASINRVYSVMAKKTGRATLILRLALIIIMLVAFQVAFNPNFLFTVMSSVVGTLDAAFFVPVIWPSLAILGVIAGNMVTSIVYVSLTLVFVILLFFAAVSIRTKYWSPSLASVSLASKRGYAPRYSRLGRFGFSSAEASILSKDFKAYVRQKELIPFLALPFTLSAVLVLQQFTISSNTGNMDFSWLAAWLAAFSAIFVSASSIGIEGRNFSSMYVMPLQPKELVKAKASSSLTLAIGGALLMSLISAAFTGFNPRLSFQVFFLTILGATQSVFVGLYFAVRHSDFTVRPKPRYISSWGTLKAALSGTGLVALLIAPMLLMFQSQPYESVLISSLVFLLTSILSYRYALKGASTLMREMRV